MLDIIAQGEEAGLDKDMIFALQDFHEYALGAIAENIKESRGVSWEKAYDQAWDIITGAKDAKKVKVTVAGIETQADLRSSVQRSGYKPQRVGRIRTSYTDIQAGDWPQA